MKRILWAVLAMSVVTAGCSDPPVPPAPTPVVPTSLDTFNDTLLVSGVNTHLFTTKDIGGVKVTLNSVEPGAIVGVGIGTPSLGTCSLIDRTQAVAGKTVIMSGTTTVPGQYCISIFDLGNLVEPAVYSIDVLHS